MNYIAGRRVVVGRDQRRPRIGASRAGRPPWAGAGMAPPRPRPYTTPPPALHQPVPGVVPGPHLPRPITHPGTANYPPTLPTRRRRRRPDAAFPRRARPRAADDDMKDAPPATTMKVLGIDRGETGLENNGFR